jgi:hypothetical protein
MSLGWLRFFGTSVNKEEKENSCGLRAEKFFARTKHSSSRLHSSRSKDNVLPDNHANDVGRVQEAQENKDIWDLSNIGLDEKIQLFGRRESKSRKEKSKLVIAHLYFITNIFFRASLFKCFFWSNQLSRFEMHNVFYFIFSHGKII